ncbi:MAG: N-acetylmuramoyl-L-alanine amidase [Bacteroidetes bacterium]|nr:N-acetylmuramoyl-L-alanine amidase [Bacteroidota bacterium]
MNPRHKLFMGISLLCSLPLIPAAQAQNSHRIQKTGPLPLDAFQPVDILLPAPYDCFVLRVNGDVLPEFLLLDGDTLRPDPHAPEGCVQSLPQFTKKAGVQLPVSASLTVFFMEVGSAGMPMPAAPRNNMPPVIPQSIWRAGLNPPKPGPVSTPTEHAIIHHSAGNTNETDYVKVVRSYYLLHTEVNGWDDIGYNFLIASDGSIFAGRDPQGVQGVRQDNVRGAHFCGKNEYTMGVCLIGDYTSVQPPFPAVNSLCRLLAWKLEQDGLNPFGAMKHPDNSGSLLGTLAGHRDGCSTECPGDKVYAQAEAIRECVALRLSEVQEHEQALQPFRIAQDGNGVHIHSARGEDFNLNLYGMDGCLLQSGGSTGGSHMMTLDRAGVYILELRSAGGVQRVRVVSGEW